MSGEADQVAGTAKELGGKVTGNSELEAEGTTQHGIGKVEHALGEVADKVKGAAEEAKDKIDGHGRSH